MQTTSPNLPVTLGTQVWLIHQNSFGTIVSGVKVGDRNGFCVRMPPTFPERYLYVHKNECLVERITYHKISALTEESVKKTEVEMR